MAKAKKKWVAFRTNTTVPKSVLGRETDQKMQAGKPVQLPAGYADHVVHDRFADFCDDPGKDRPKKSGGPTAAEKAAAEAAAKLEAARKAVTDAEARVREVAGTVDENEALAALDAARTSLAELEPAP